MIKKKREIDQGVSVPFVWIVFLCLLLLQVQFILAVGETSGQNDDSSSAENKIEFPMSKRFKSDLLLGAGNRTMRKLCEQNFTQLWPPDPEGGKTLVLGFLLSIKGSTVERFGLKIPGMLSYAIEKINEDKILPEGYTLQVQVQDTNGEEIKSIRSVTDMACNQIAGIIGPDNSCLVEASIAEAKNIPMISYACTDALASGKKTFARTNPSEIHILKATIDTLLYFKWTKFIIIYEDNRVTMAKTLNKLAKEANMSVNGLKPFSAKSELPDLFVETKEETRIYVLLCHQNKVSKALLAMTLSGLIKATKKDYFLIFVEKEEFKDENWPTYIFDPLIVDVQTKSNECLSKEMNVYADSFMLIANTPIVTASEIENIAREYNKKQPFCLATDLDNYLNRNRMKNSPSGSITTRKHVPIFTAGNLYDAVKLYADAIRDIYNSSDGEWSVEDIGRNGTAIANWITNRTFKSILGFDVEMGADRASRGSYSAYYFTSDQNCSNPEHTKTFNCSTHCLLRVSDVRGGTLNTAVKINVLDMPPCGFKNELCDHNKPNIRMIIMITLIVCVTLLIFFSFFQYRHWKYEQEISGLSWRINREELLYKLNNNINTSRVSIASFDCSCPVFAPDRMAEYKGTTCCLKPIDLDSKKQDLNRKVMKQMKSMREIKHRNVCQFIGAYVHDRKLVLVTEYATRGSLEDIMQNPDIKLDELFISSLVKDLLRAMLFLHGSFGPHGNLKSNNCVVTGRWVLQVTDYDLHEIRYEHIKALMREHNYQDTADWGHYVKSLLWRAPEILREEGSPGTKEGDLYSFGIILHEIIARQGPFSTYDIDDVPYLEMIDEIKSGSTRNGSLRRPDVLDMVLHPYGTDPDIKSAMESAWAEDPKARPEFKELSHRLKKMKRSHGNLVDHMVNILEGHNKNLEEKVALKTSELRDSKKRSEQLLHSMLPEEVARSICSNIDVPPKSFDSVTIYFSDIVGFTSLASESTPYQIFEFLDDLYKDFDNTISGFDVYKVETIGDAYMVVSGLPDSKKKVPHAGAIASMALELLEKTKSFKIRHKPDHKLKLRIGLHTGPVIAGVVGQTMPRYCLFGDTVNMASRMESNGAPLRIHISEDCKNALDSYGGYDIEQREKITVKGKGEVQTYWLNAAKSGAIKRREAPLNIMPVSSSMVSEGTEIRRRSPRLSIDTRSIKSPDTPSTARSTRDPADICFTARSDSPPRDLAHHHLRRISNTVRAGSVGAVIESQQYNIGSKRINTIPSGDFKNFSPKKTSKSRTSSAGSVRESHSLDRLPDSAQEESRLFNVPKKTSSSSSSEPTLPVEDAPRVNFSKSARFRDAEGNETEEMNPMLENQDEFYLENELDGESSSSAKKNSIKTFFQGIFPKAKRERLNSEKASLNGLQRESHV